jgi:hypothetical protein
VSTLNNVAHTELNSVLTTMNNGTPPDPSMLQQMIAELVRKQPPSILHPLRLLMERPGR